MIFCYKIDKLFLFILEVHLFTPLCEFNTLSKMPCCSFCNEAGHNIRTCQDQRIAAGIMHLLATYVAPCVNREFTPQELVNINLYLLNMPDRLLHAISIQYCRTRRSDFIDIHIQKIVDKICAELQNLNQLDDASRDRWFVSVLGVPYSYTIQPDPDSITYLDDSDMSFYIDHEPSELPVEPAFHVVKPIMLCLETASELAVMKECIICQEEKPTFGFTTTNCNHDFCHDCICMHIKLKEMTKPACPLCRSTITSLTVKDVDKYYEIDNKFSRTRAIFKDCSRMAFGDSMWGESKNYEETITMFLQEFSNNKTLMERISSASTYKEKAEHMWRHLYYFTNIEKNVARNLDEEFELFTEW